MAKMRDAECKAAVRAATDAHVRRYTGVGGFFRMLRDDVVVNALIGALARLASLLSKAP